ncbi:ATP-binding protein [Roseomonas sp. BN140053]|uniref:hybrid sensor histidine kinase/response regulator n=1 Tax=Roseomonas sp. BN140053 TaxID=3391898 RepID=UPI0039EA8DA6
MLPGPERSWRQGVRTLRTRLAATFTGRPGRLARAAMLAGVLAACAILAATTAAVDHIRARDEATAHQDLTTLTAVLAEQTARTLQSVELVLGGIADDVAERGVATPEGFATLAASAELRDALRARLAGIPQLDALTLIAADGRLLNFPRPIPVPAVNVADRDYFAALRDATGAATFLSAPVSNRGTGTGTIYLARRLSGPDGRFLGLVLGAMELSYFERFYERLLLRPGMRLALWRTDGTLLVSHPAWTGPVRENRAAAFAALPPGEVVAGVTRSALNGRPVLLARSQLQGLPVVMATSRGMEAVLSAWRMDAAVLSAAGLLCAALALAISGFVAGRFRAFDTLARALAARQAAEHGLREAEQRLRRAQQLEALGQLAGGVAHDFNNVLQVVAGGARLIRRRAGDPDTVIRMATMVAEAADRGTAVTSRLLAFAHRGELQNEALDPAALLDGISEVLRHTLGPGIRVVVAAAPDLPPVLADRAQLETVLVNLATNARDAMPEGGTLTLAARAEAAAPDRGDAAPGSPAPGDAAPDDAAPDDAAPGTLAISVSDTGTGMDAATLARAAEPFFTTKPKGKGTGLGLAMARGFAEQSGGSLAVHSAPGRGTEVVLRLPRAAAAPLARPAGQAALPARLAGGRVLLVDDEAEVRSVLAESLREAGLAVTEAASAAEALAAPEMDTTELLLTDLAMPGMSGLDLLRAARRRRPGLPVLLVTGFLGDAPPEDLAEAEAGGPFVLLRKPVDPGSLAAEADALLRAAAAARNAAATAS